MNIFNFSYEDIEKAGKKNFDCFFISYQVSGISVSKKCKWHKKFLTMFEILMTLKTLKCVCKVRKCAKVCFY